MVGVKFTLVALVVALLFAGIFATATGNERDNSTGNQQVAHTSADTNFLTSLRFWERNRESALPQLGRSSSRETQAKAQNVPVGKPGNAAPQRSATPRAAPAPPSIPFAGYQEHRGLGNAPLPEWSENFAYDTHERSASSPLEMQPSMASHLSYSFDTRDWVESFPLQNEVGEGVFATIQATSLHVPMLPPVLQGDASGNDNWGGDDWNGHATALVTYVQQNHDQNAVMHVLPAATPAEKPQIDLSPSYQRRLPYVQTCGVVVVQANFPLTEIASILDEINMLQHDLTRYIGVPAPREKIELCLFKDESSYMEFLREFFPRAPRDRRALYVKLDNKPGTLMVQKSKDFEVDLRHEMTHAIVHASISRVPIWLDEGLAKYFEVPPQDRANNHPYMTQIRRNARLGNVPFLDRLARLETIDDMGAREYRDSWAWTHFLIHRSPETHRLLAAYLQMLANYPETEGDFAKTGNAFDLAFPGGRYFGLDLNITRGRERPSPIPSLKLYLDDVMPNQREAFREHFGAMER